MKKLIIILALATFAFVGCGETKTNSPADNQEQIEQVEKQTDEMDKASQEIDESAEELDQIIEEL